MVAPSGHIVPRCFGYKPTIGLSALGRKQNGIKPLGAYCVESLALSLCTDKVCSVVANGMSITEEDVWIKIVARETMCH